MTEKIYEEMTEYIGLSGANFLPELFSMVADLEEAELCMAMPGTAEQLAEKVGKPVDKISKMCAELYHKGVAFKSFKSGGLGYKMCRNFIQFHDATILWPEAPKEFLDLWQKCMEEEMPRWNRMAAEMRTKPSNRIIAIESSIDSKQQILDADSAEKIVREAEVIAVTDCTCRTIAKKCDSPLDVCMQTDNAARYALDRGTGKELNQEEALAMLRKAEEAGLVHVTLNRVHSGHYICNCCRCCCQTFPILLNEGLQTCDPSRYEAQIDAEACTNCGMCTDRCFFSALEEVEHNGETVMQVIKEKCMGCGVCHVTCPADAITLVKVREIEFIPV
jgi:Pyruvate/2-oxoacid:ferredoxin oxidoreductase delta subunit